MKADMVNMTKPPLWCTILHPIIKANSNDHPFLRPKKK
jgi:hypothetical protein